MLVRTVASRTLLLRALSKNANIVKLSKRNSGHGTWSYRVPPPMPSRFSLMLAEGIGALCWWWVFWHILTEPEHVYGEWPYVHPSTWTDEELGVPPDDQGALKALKDIE